MQWHWVDIAIIAVITISMLTGLFRGFVKEIIALFTWVLAIWLGFHYSQSLDPWLASYLQDKTVRAVVAFFLILFSVLLVGAIINALISVILKRAGLNGTDRTLGMGFGFIRGVFIVALIILAINMTSLPSGQYAHESKLYAKFDPVVKVIYGFMPDFIKKIKAFEHEEPSISSA